jgi:hypothetical protein
MRSESEIQSPVVPVLTPHEALARLGEREDDDPENRPESDR